MRKTPIKAIALFLSILVLFGSCSSSTMINSSPTGAKVYINGESVGTTPYKHSDTKIVGSSSSIRLEKEGYESFNTSISRNEQADVGAIIGGIFTLVPFLWTMKYNPEHSYELVPEGQVKKEKKESLTSQKLEDLKKLKELHDEKVLTDEEYEIEKKKILDQ